MSLVVDFRVVPTKRNYRLHVRHRRASALVRRSRVRAASSSSGSSGRQGLGDHSRDGGPIRCPGRVDRRFVGPRRGRSPDLGAGEPGDDPSVRLQVDRVHARRVGRDTGDGPRRARPPAADAAGGWSPRRLSPISAATADGRRGRRARTAMIRRRVGSANSSIPGPFRFGISTQHAAGRCTGTYPRSTPRAPPTSRDGSAWSKRPEDGGRRCAARRDPPRRRDAFRVVRTRRTSPRPAASAARRGRRAADPARWFRLVGTTRKSTRGSVDAQAPRADPARTARIPTIVGTTVRRRDDGRRGVAHDATTAEIGVFGGSGFYSLLEDVREVKVDTPYGPPSDSVFLAEVAGRRVAFLPRHGRRHTIPPHKINYRANVWAMRSLGVKAVISPCAAGSLQPHVKPGDFVVCDQFVDRTSGRDRHVLRRPDRHPPLLGRDLRPGPARPRDRHDPRPRHRGPRARHGRRHRRARGSRPSPNRSGSATPAGRSST